MGASIALGIDHQSNRKILQDWLETWWQTRLMSDETLEQRFAHPETDLYIVDYKGIQHFSEKLIARRQHAEPIFLPIFYLGKLQELQTMPKEVAEIVDDFVALPVQREELIRRIRRLLRTRDLSIENDQNRRISQELRIAMDSSSDAIFLLDADNHVRYSNQTSKQLIDTHNLQYTNGDAFKALFRDSDDIFRLIDTVKENSPYRGEVQIKLDDTREATALLRVNSLQRNDTYQGTVIVITDITEQKRIQVAEREQRVFAQVLRDIAMTIVSTLDLQEVFDRLLNQLGRVIHYDYANIALLNDKDEVSIERRAGYSESEMNQPMVNGVSTIADTDLMRQVYETKRPLVLDSIEDSPLSAKFKSHITARAYIGVPILLRNRVIGFLNVFSSQRESYRPQDADRMVALADLVAIAMDNANLYEQVQEIARQEARSHLARDLHDSVTQSLFSAAVMTEAIPRLWNTKPEMAENLLTELHQLTRGALAQTRTLLLELRPEALSQYSIYELLHQLAESMLSRKQINVQTHIEPIDELTPDQQHNMYFIAHEALNNVIKHSKAQHVDITLKQQGKIVILNIHDDGVGFDEQSRQYRGMGLSIMRERAAEAEIKLSITSDKDRGTDVRIELDTNGI